MALVKCSECGKQISDDAGACPQCGKPVTIPEPVAPAPEKKSLFLPLLVVVIILGVLGFFALEKFKESREELGEEAKEIIETVNPNKVKEPEVLFDGKVDIKEDKFGKVLITVGKKADVEVTYQVISGPKLEIFTFNEGNFKLWEENPKADVQPVKKLSESGMESGTLKDTLPAGNYYVVIDNTNYGTVKPPTNLRTDVVSVQLKVSQLEKE